MVGIEGVSLWKQIVNMCVCGLSGEKDDLFRFCENNQTTFMHTAQQ